MDFINDSPFPAELIRSVIVPGDAEPMLGVVVVKVTYEVAPDGSLRPAAEQLPIRREAEETGFGVEPPDTAAQKPGCDLFVFGRAVAPGGAPATGMRVRLRVGDAMRELAIHGDRFWDMEEVEDKKKKKKKLKKGETPPPPEYRWWITEPRPFTEIPLDYAHAYGGKAKALNYESPYPYNPAGKGFILQGVEAKGVPLPNVEDPSAPVRTWEDRPRPVGFAPVELGTMFTVERGIEYDAERNEQRVKPEVFHNAHPDLVFPALPPGTSILVEGMTPEAPFAFRLPELAVRVEVKLGEKVYEPAGKVDTVAVYVDPRRVYLIHRTPFKYVVVPEELRTARLEVLGTGVPS